SRLVQRVHQKLKIIRRPLPGRRRIKSRHLITPRRIKRVLGHRQKLHVREPHLLHVRNQLPRQFPVAERFRQRFLPPRAHVHLVNAHRRSQRILLAPALQPVRVAPSELPRVPHNRRILRRCLEEKSIRIRLQLHRPLNLPHLILVMRPLPHSRHEQLPHPPPPTPPLILVIPPPPPPRHKHPPPPDAPSARIGLYRPSHPLKSPTTLIRCAF